MAQPAAAVPSPPETGIVEPASPGEPGTASPAESNPVPGSGETGEKEEAQEVVTGELIPWHDSLLELPEWMRQEEEEITSGTRPANQGGGLFPPQVWAVQPAPELGPLVKDHPPEPATPPSPDALIQAAVPLGPAQMALYTSTKPAGVFWDPQHLVQDRPTDWMESLVKRWLNEQCVFHTIVLVFGPGQLLPAGFDPQALSKQWFGDTGQSLLVLYFYRQPERTLAIFGPAARAVYRDDLLRSTVDAAVTEAGRIPGAAEQLERFCYKMSVRLHWLSRLKVNDAPATVSPSLAPAGAAPGRLAAWLVLGGSSLMAAGLAGRAWLRRRSTGTPETQQILLPERESVPRFGAPHSGGFCAVVSFPVNPAPP